MAARFDVRNSALHSPFTGSASDRAQAVRSLLIAAAVTIGLYFVPYLGWVTYPLHLLGTFIHEGSHALIALLVGGSVRSIAIQPDGSGLTMSLLPVLPMGWLQNVLVSSAGYLGATLYGALLIALLRRGVSGSRLLLATGVLVALVTLGVLKGLIFTGNVFGLFWGVVIAAVLILAGLRLPKQTAAWSAAFVGVQCVLNAFFGLRDLFLISVSSGEPTDAQTMFKLTLIPAPVWAVLWIAMSLVMLAIVLRPAKR